MRVYDGRAERWVDLRFTVEIDSRWMEQGSAMARVLRSERQPGDERYFRAVWSIGETKVLHDQCRALRSEAEADARRIWTPACDIACPSCEERWLFPIGDRAGYVCAACGGEHSFMRVHDRSYVFPVRQRQPAPKIDDAIEVMLLIAEVNTWVPARVIRDGGDTFAAEFRWPDEPTHEPHETCALSKVHDLGKLWRWPS